MTVCSPVGVIGQTVASENKRTPTLPKGKLTENQVQEIFYGLPMHLQEMIRQCRTPLSTEQRYKICGVIRLNQDVFAVPDGPTGSTDQIQHTINTGNA